MSGEGHCRRTGYEPPRIDWQIPEELLGSEVLFHWATDEHGHAARQENDRAASIERLVMSNADGIYGPANRKRSHECQHDVKHFDPVDRISNPVRRLQWRAATYARSGAPLPRR